MYINNLQRAKDYKEKVEMSIELLPISTVFSDQEKADLMETYQLQLKVINEVIVRNTVVVEPIEVQA